MRSKINVHLIATLSGHKDAIYGLSQGKDHQTFYSAGGDGMVIEWDQNDFSKATLVAKASNSVYNCLYDSYENYLCFLDNYFGLRIIDPVEKKEVANIKLSGVKFFSITSDQNNIYVGSEIGELYVIDKSNFVYSRFLISNKSIRDIKPLNENLICSLSDNSVKILEKFSFQPLKSINAHEKSVFSTIFLPQNEKFVSVGRDAHMVVFDAESMNVEKNVVAHIFPINDIALSPDKTLFVTGSMDKNIKVWDSKEYHLLKVIDNARHQGHTSSVNRLLWTSHKNQVISCSDDKTIKVWQFEPYT